MLSSISTKPCQRGVVGGRRAAAHRRHLHAQQLPAARGGDELRRGLRRAALQALLDALQRMRHQLAVEHGVDRAAQADQLGAAGQRGRVATARGTAAARGCCRAGCGRPGCTPPRSASARPSAPPGGCAPARCRGWPRPPAAPCRSRSCVALRAPAALTARARPRSVGAALAGSVALRRRSSQQHLRLFQPAAPARATQRW